MGLFNRKQEGVFIGVFALATLVVISLAVGFMSNRVNDLLSNQGQMIAGRQAYWLAFSGMETVAQDRLGDLGNPDHPQQHLQDNTKDDTPDAGVVYNKHYSLAGGRIEVSGVKGSGYHNGLGKTKYITVTGTDANSERKIKWTLGSPDKRGFNFSRSSNEQPLLTMVSAIDTISSLPANEFTISAWVQMDAIDVRPLFGLEADVDNHWIQFTSATVMGFKGTGDVVPLTHGFTIPTGSWQHVVITRAPVTHIVTVYLNSIAGSTAVWNEAFSPDAVGTSYNGGERKYFDGRIANLALWTRALTEREIQSIYIQGFTFNLIGDDLLNGLHHYWEMDDAGCCNDATDRNNDLEDPPPTGGMETGI